MDPSTIKSQDFVQSLPSKGRPPEGCSKHLELRALNAELFIYLCQDAEVTVLVTGDGDILVNSLELL